MPMQCGVVRWLVVVVIGNRYVGTCAVFDVAMMPLWDGAARRYLNHPPFLSRKKVISHRFTSSKSP